jgi:anti-sigma B factor antagonist
MAQENKMDEIKISLDATGANGEISVVRVDGVIDTMTASELEKVMNSLMERSRYNIIIDLGGVDYISSAGWGIFISNIREIRQHAGDLKLARMIPNVYEIYELLEFDSILQAYENVEKAKADFNFSSDSVDGAVDIKPEISAVEAIDEKPAAADDEKSEDEVQPPREESPEKREKKAGSADEEKRVLDLAADDPFLSIREMKKILNSQAGDYPRLGWWRIRKILRRHDILSKRKRFRFARK